MTTQTETTWMRYQRIDPLYIGSDKKEKVAVVEYEVEVDEGEPVIYGTAGEDEQYHRIRTVRNHAYPEEIHTPAYTLMPSEKFSELYERVG